MKHAIAPLWTLAALALIPAAATAQQQGPPHGGHRPPPSALIQVLDADHDHQISADELKNAATALAKLDTNGDGKLSEDELRPKPPEGAPPADNDSSNKAGGPPPPPEDGDKGKSGNHPKPPKDPLMTALDTDGDGTISADELAAAATSLAKLDKDSDGAISEKEFRPERPKDGGGREARGR